MKHYHDNFLKNAAGQSSVTNTENCMQSTGTKCAIQIVLKMYLQSHTVIICQPISPMSTSDIRDQHGTCTPHYYYLRQAAMVASRGLAWQNTCIPLENAGAGGDARTKCVGTEDKARNSRSQASLLSNDSNTWSSCAQHFGVAVEGYGWLINVGKKTVDERILSDQSPNLRVSSHFQQLRTSIYFLQ